MSSAQKFSDQYFGQISGTQMNILGKWKPVVYKAPIKVTFTWIELVISGGFEVEEGGGEGKGARCEHNQKHDCSWHFRVPLLANWTRSQRFNG